MLRRRLMSLEQIPPLACDLSPTAIGVTGVEERAWRWHLPPSPPILGLAGERGSPAWDPHAKASLAGGGQRFDLLRMVREIASLLGSLGGPAAFHLKDHF